VDVHSDSILVTPIGCSNDTRVSVRDSPSEVTGSSACFSVGVGVSSGVSMSFRLSTSAAAALVTSGVPAPTTKLALGVAILILEYVGLGKALCL
jgi:hypothetical protein